ncbi:hypothetical protein IWZ03DRAFT_386118 [Phyllosticta citriasiana]|uniref:Secreted protein n=1 Tax=Phyllosticta citriasiana TaxID=595635 RepID=A0ABR1KCZ1_9PEZI
MSERHYTTSLLAHSLFLLIIKRVYGAGVQHLLQVTMKVRSRSRVLQGLQQTRSVSKKGDENNREQTEAGAQL